MKLHNIQLSIARNWKQLHEIASYCTKSSNCTELQVIARKCRKLQLIERNCNIFVDFATFLLIFRPTSKKVLSHHHHHQSNSFNIFVNFKAYFKKSSESSSSKWFLGSRERCSWSKIINLPFLLRQKCSNYAWIEILIMV